MSTFKINAIDLEKGVRFFNEGLYFKAHEVWEKLWLSVPLSPERDFIQGMIKIAAALHKYIKKEYAGTEKLLWSGLKILRENQEAEIPINREAFINDISEFYEKFKVSKEIDTYPKISMTS